MSNKVYTTLGASNHSDGDRQEDDYYATDPNTIIPLLERITANKNIREPSCGEGHLSKKLIELGYDVVSSDLIERGYGKGGVNFLHCEKKRHGDIITNPPYKYAQEFVQKSLDLINDGNQVVMFLKLQFLEGQKRKKLFAQRNLKKVLVFSARQKCAKNGEFEKSNSNAIAYAWYVREKGYNGDTTIERI